jgi:hypothetical protein
MKDMPVKCGLKKENVTAHFRCVLRRVYPAHSDTKCGSDTDNRNTTNSVRPIVKGCDTLFHITFGVLKLQSTEQDD